MAAIALIVGCSVYVSIQYKEHSENAASDAQQPSSKPFKAHTNQQPETNVSQPKWDPPRWYRLFSWPDGIQVWGLFLTLFVIAEQTKETARAGRASEESAAVAEKAIILAQRPQIAVRRFRLDDFVREGSYASGAFEVINVGGSNARRLCIVCVSYVGSASQLPWNSPYANKEGETGPNMFTPGSRERSYFRMEEPLTESDADKFRDGSYSLYALGFISYCDDLNFVRTTYFARRYDRASQRFVPVNDPDYEITV